MNPTRDLILARLGTSREPVSGDLLAGELGLSRAGIWKHIQSLRKQGIDIESVGGRGYLLKSDVLSPALVLSRLKTKRIGKPIEVLEETDSTNREAMRRAEIDINEGLVVIANHQREGRGRLGRSWFTAGNDSLAMSVLLKPDARPEHVPQLSLLAAVAVQRALASFAPTVRIKWPNDLLAGGAKLAGILTEMRAEPGRVHAVVIGIGINVRKPGSGWPKTITQPATDISTLAGRNISRLEVAAAVINALDDCYREYLDHGFVRIREWWWEAHAAGGKIVRAHSDDGYVEGIAEALDEDGALLLRVDGELRRFIAGDIELLGEVTDNSRMESNA